jgi:hypothetical protein
MDGKQFDQIVKILSNFTLRRDALKSLVGAAVAASLGIAETSAKKKKKKKGRKKKKKRTDDVVVPPPPPPPPPCVNRRQPCGTGAKCCGEELGLVACRQFPTVTCPTLSGPRCCGLEGADCDNSVGINNCDCCDGLFCGGTTGIGKCQEEFS